MEKRRKKKHCSMDPTYPEFAFLGELLVVFCFVLFCSVLFCFFTDALMKIGCGWIPAWISLGQGTYYLLSRRNLYETRGADPGCDGIKVGW